MYRGVIQQRADITEYLRDHIVTHKLENPTGLGRIYRVVHESAGPTARGHQTASATELVDLLSDPNGWWRDTAQQLLVQRNDRSVVPALTKLATGAPDFRTRLHALWTLDGLDAIDQPTVVKALEDSSRDVRSSAIRLSERWLSTPDSPVQAAVLKRMDDTDWSVRQQLAASLGVLPAVTRPSAVAKLLERYGDDSIVVDAALSGLSGSEAATLDALARSTTKSTAVEASMTMLGATIVRAGDDASVQALLASVGDQARPGWQRAAMLRGAEVALLGAVAPGTPAPRRGLAAAPGLPCPTCPGGRAGRGGAYAFAQVPVQRGGRGGSRAVRLDREPPAFVALAASGDELASRATAVLARVEWAGKAGAGAAVAPLSPEEQRRFDAGREVYRNVCQACHQPDGRGQERLAANLIGSTLALGPAEIPARILLNGKEGPVGLMPPVGQIFTDEQIADVLTYIRREWGQAGSAVDPATIADVRAKTAARTRPWTNDELNALLPGAGR
jgi:mono/diheme cytochrome c family protein